MKKFFLYRLKNWHLAHKADYLCQALNVEFLIFASLKLKKDSSFNFWGAKSLVGSPDNASLVKHAIEHEKDAIFFIFKGQTYLFRNDSELSALPIVRNRLSIPGRGYRKEEKEKGEISCKEEKILLKIFGDDCFENDELDMVKILTQSTNAQTIADKKPVTLYIDYLEKSLEEHVYLNKKQTKFLLLCLRFQNFFKFKKNVGK